MNRTPVHPELPQILQRMIATYQARGDQDSTRIAGELALAAAGIADLSALQQFPQRPFQIALLGPTQVGKSTVANLLCGAVAAEVSPLAGFTIHPQGFQTGSDDEHWLQASFASWERVAQSDLRRDVVKQYSMTHRTDGQPLTDQPLVVWDTPDFDSLRAPQYLQSVFHIAALSDLLVLVLSREKYSDLAVWETMQLLAPLQRPFVVCLNKTDESVAAELGSALRGRLAEFTPHQADAPIICLPQVPNLGQRPVAEWPAQVDTLRDTVGSAIYQRDPDARQRHARALTHTHGNRWLAPIRAEHTAAEDWMESLQAARDEAERTYRRDYLEHPQRFDTFQRAIAELLTLLEVPGVAGMLTQVRQVLTWPARQLFAGRTWWQSADKAHSSGNEALVLDDVFNRMVLHAQRTAARRLGDAGAGDWWQAVHVALESGEANLRTGFDTSVAQYREKFVEQIQNAARSLYEELQQRPALLNTLRAARTTADAASIALAVKTAGLGVDALLLAPAMVGVTSMLTEGALGSYMQTVAGRLRTQQLEALRTQVLIPAIQQPLVALPNVPTNDKLFGIRPDQLNAVGDWFGPEGAS